MRQPSAIARLRLGILALCVIFLIGFVGYQVAGWSPVEAAYMTVLILSTVGLETVHPLGPGLMLFSTVLTAVGVFAVLYIMGVFIQMTTEGELNRALGIQKLTRSVQRLSGHVIICGFGRMGEILAEQLKRQGLSFVLIEKDTERVAEATALNHLVIADDATEERTLELAGIERAESLVTSLPVDADNVFITLTARGTQSGVADHRPGSGSQYGEEAQTGRRQSHRPPGGGRRVPHGEDDHASIHDGTGRTRFRTPDFRGGRRGNADSAEEPSRREDGR